MSGLLLTCIFIFYFYLILFFHNIEINFSKKLIYFNSKNFENYFSKLNEIKKNLKNESSEEDAKEENLDFIDSESKKDNFEEIE